MHENSYWDILLWTKASWICVHYEAERHNSADMSDDDQTDVEMIFKMRLAEDPLNSSENDKGEDDSDITAQSKLIPTKYFQTIGQ